MIFRDSNELNYVVINGFASPGRATISGAGMPSKWNAQPGHGQTGASITYTGRELASFTITIDMWNQEQLAQWEVWKKLLDPPKRGGLDLGLGISHPQLADVGIKECIVEDRSPPERKGALWTVTIKCKEYRKRAPVKVKLKGAVPSTGSKPVPAVTEADRALVAAREQAARDKSAAQ